MTSLKKYISEKLLILFIELFQKKSQSNIIEIGNNPEILLIHFGNIQDSLSITPLLNLLITKSNGSISIITNQTNEVVFNNNRSIKKIILLKNGIFETFKTFLKLIRIEFNLIIDSTEYYNLQSVFVVGLLKSQYKIGFTKKSDSLFTHKVNKLSPNKTHLIDRKLKLFELLSIVFSKANLNIIYKTSGISKSIIENYLIRNDLNFKPKVIINISSKTGIGFWGVDNYKKLVKYFKNYDINIIFLSSLDDKESVEKITKNNNQIYYDIEFDHVAELVKNVDFLFSPDSYLIQLASAYKIPVFCLFVQNENNEIINVPYNSDFDFVLTEKSNLKEISFGKVLNNFIPYFDYIYDKCNKSK